MVKPAANPLVDSELAARFSLGVIELFQGSPSAVQIYTAAQYAFHWGEYCLDLLQSVNPEPEPPACKPGCNYCCYNQVELTAPEALFMGSFLADKLPPEALTLLLARVEKLCSRRHGKTKRELAALRAEFSCPLLDAGHCLAYEVRPLMCRAMHALQMDTCRQELTDPNLNLVEFYLHRHIIHVSISQGLVDACLALGYQPGPVDLVSALREYFSQSELTQSWLAGKDVFK
jgi:Fe-S-cluster containining protein